MFCCCAISLDHLSVEKLLEMDGISTDEDYEAYDVIDIRREECYKMIRDHNQTEAFQKEIRICPPTFDGWSCWNSTEAGQTAFTLCPYFITGFDPKRMAHKFCNEYGTWFQHPDSNATWSNYTTCVDIEDLKMRQVIINVYISGYSISLIALIASLIILCAFRRSLKCTRIHIHRNLFVSFVINNAMWLLWYKGVADQPQVLLQNGVGCKILHIVLHYFLVSNYFWMFCEGLYLHTLLVVAFLSENSIMKWFHLIGWCIPAVLTLIYAAVRASIPEQTNHCWMEEGPTTWILSGPVCASMLANVFFLVNIVRVLVTKLKSPGNIRYEPRNGAVEGDQPLNVFTESRSNEHGDHVQPRSSSWSVPSLASLRKAVRATFILLPLLGLHYVVMPFRPEPGAPGEIAYQIVSAVITSFQGLCVSVLFCFCNGEVLEVMRKTLLRYASSRKAGLHNRRLSIRSQHPITTEL